MAASTLILRLRAYYSRHGLRATLRRFRLSAKRILFSNHKVLFYCDLSTLDAATSNLPSRVKVERYKMENGLPVRDLEELTSFWSPELARRNIIHRFEMGASLWLIRFENKLAGYGWTLQGQTVEPHYFLLGTDDVHLFDFQVFPEFRGRSLNPALVGHILHTLAAECQGRAFIEAAEWNQSQLASLRKTSFRHLGAARKFAFLRRAIVCWEANKISGKRQCDHVNNSSVAAQSNCTPEFRA